MKKILLFTYLCRHLKKMLPLIQEFEKEKRLDLTVILMTKEERDLAKSYGICYTMLDAFTSRKRRGNFDLAWGLEPLINAIDVLQPDLFLAIEVNYILRNAIRYCKYTGIPNLIIQHGTPNIYSLHAFLPFEGDCFLAWGDFTKDFLIAHGMEKDKIIVTGGIPFDRTRTLQPDKENIANMLQIDPNKKWIVFTTQGVSSANRPSEEEVITGVTEIAKNISNFPDYQMIFQVHPEQQIEDIKNFISHIEHYNSIVAKYQDTEELMAATDGVITFFSTTAIDAMVLHKPLLLINLTDDRNFFPFVRMGAAFGAYSKSEIGIQLQQMLEHPEIVMPNITEVAEYVNYRCDGKALERVMKVCYNVLNLERI